MDKSARLHRRKQAGKNLHKQIDLPMAVNAVEFSAAGKLLAASVNDGTILVWEMGSLLGK